MRVVDALGAHRDILLKEHNKGTLLALPTNQSPLPAVDSMKVLDVWKISTGQIYCYVKDVESGDRWLAIFESVEVV